MNPLDTISHYLFLALFCGTATLALIASAYLLLRPHNVFSSEINPPLRLRRWTAAFLATVWVSHMCWLLIFYADTNLTRFDSFIFCVTVDAFLSLPTLLCTMVVMLQDRRRPLWPVAIVVALVLVLLQPVYASGSQWPVVVLAAALLIFVLISVGLLYMLRQYEHWLRDNYADLENKEVWQTFAVVAGFVLISIAYNLANGHAFVEVLLEVLDSIFILFLVWRVETLQTLEKQAGEEEKVVEVPDTDDPVFLKIETLLQQHCVDAKYYLRHDASQPQLAKVIGTNTTYLSYHFARQGLSYNTYINTLRINHFICLFEDCIHNKKQFTAANLANKSGFRSYSTFGSAFRQIKGQSVRAWMDEHGHSAASAKKKGAQKGR